MNNIVATFLLLLLFCSPFLVFIGIYSVQQFIFRRRVRRLMESLQMLFFRATFKNVKPGITTIGVIQIGEHSYQKCCGEAVCELKEIVRTSKGIYQENIANICSECGTVNHKSCSTNGFFGPRLKEGMNFFEFMAQISEDRAAHLFGRIDTPKTMDDESIKPDKLRVV